MTWFQAECKSNEDGDLCPVVSGTLSAPSGVEGTSAKWPRIKALTCLTGDSFETTFSRSICLRVHHGLQD